MPPLQTYRQAPQSGLRGLVYSIATLANGAITHGTVKPLPGARALERNPNAEVGTFPSDNASTWQYANNGNIDIGLELDAADVQTRAELLGLSLDSTSGVMDEVGNENPPDLAFGYIKDTLDDDQQEYVWLLWGKFTEDSESNKTDENGKRDPQGYKLKGSFGRQPIERRAGRRRRHLMSQVFDYSDLMNKTRAVQVILDRAYTLRYPLPAITEFEAHFGKSVKEWLEEVSASGAEPRAEDMYYIAWLGFNAGDKKLTLEEFTSLVPWPVINRLFNGGPVMLALVGYEAAEGNSHRAAEAGRLPFINSLASLLAWIRTKRGRQPQKK